MGKFKILPRRVGIVFGLVLMVISVYSQKIFPGAEGFGTDSRGAYSGSSTPTILIVDTLADGNFSTGTNRGTLEWAISRDYPRIILFEVSGVIDLDDDINLNHPYASVYGQTAPYPGITIKSAIFKINADHVLIQHMKFRAGDELNGHYLNSRDCFLINGDKVTIDHCSFSWSIDELIEIRPGSGEITISNSIFAEPFVKSYHFNESNGEPEIHCYAFYSNDCDLTLKNNLFAYSRGRNPYVKPGKKAIVNNVFYNTNYAGPMFYDRDNEIIEASVVGNVILPIPNNEYHRGASERIATIFDDVNTNSRFYFSDNLCQLNIDNPNLTQWDCVEDRAGVNRASSSPFSLNEYNILPANELESYVLDNVGAFYWSRDYVDDRITNGLANRENYMIDSQDSLPARVYNWIESSNGNFLNGYNFESNPCSFTVNGTTILCDENCSSLTEVIDMLNNNLPLDIEAYAIYSGMIDPRYVGIRTKKAGSAQLITVSGNGLDVFGWPNGTHYGSDGSGFDYTSNNLGLNIPSNPHALNNDGYTNLEEWVAEFINNEFKTVTFNVTCSVSGSTVAGALVELSGYANGLTNAQGKVIFNQITEGSTYDYSVSKDGYIPVNGSITVNSNLTINISLEHDIDMIPPSAPQNLTGSSISATQVDLAWNAASDNVGVAGYFIYRNDVRIDSTTDLNYSDYNAPPSSQSEYEVSAYDYSNNESNKSNKVLITTLINPDTEPPSKPEDLKSTGKITTTIGLEWSASSDNVGVVGYNIYRNGTLLDVTTSLFYADNNLQPETEYLYSVTAWDQAGNESEMSDLVSVTTLPFSKIVYINPMSESELMPDGSINAPYTSWGQVTWKEGFEYRQLRNTISYEPKILITENNVFLGAYGSGERPKIITIATDYAISAFEKSKIIISDLEISAENSTGGIYFAGSVSDSNLIEKCKVIGGEYSLRIVGGNNFTIKYNELSAQLNGIYSIATNSKIYYNEIVGSEIAINIGDYSSDAEIYNNIFFSNMNAISSSYGGLTLYNNIFSLDIPGSMAINKSLDSIVSDNNIFYPIRSSFIKIGNDTYDDLLSYQSDKYVDLNSISEDPLFENPEFGDFRIQQESPAIEAGADIGLSIDKFGSSVPKGNYPDIGIQETDVILELINKPYDKKELIEIYPNPNRGEFVLKLDHISNNTPYDISVIDILGNKVYGERDISTSSVHLSLNYLLPGQYIVLIDIGRESWSKIMVIQ